MISIDELSYLVQVRKRPQWDTWVIVVHHGNGTSHIVLDEEGMTLKQVLQDTDGDIKIGCFV